MVQNYSSLSSGVLWGDVFSSGGLLLRVKNSSPENASPAQLQVDIRLQLPDVSVIFLFPPGHTSAAFRQPQPLLEIGRVSLLPIWTTSLSITVEKKLAKTTLLVMLSEHLLTC
jgi:hypothetical protein